LVDRGSSVNILYDHALNQMEDTPELARKMILPRTQSLLYEFDGSEARSPETVVFPVRADPIQRCHGVLLDVEFYNAILGRPWIHMMRAVLSTHHPLLNTPTPWRMADIRGDQAMPQTIFVARKKSGWMAKTSRAVTDEGSLMFKKQKRIAYE